MENKNILFIGPYSKKPKGGVAFVLYEYKKLYPESYFVTTTIPKNQLTKAFGFAIGLIIILFLLTTKKDIKIVHIHGSAYTSFRRKYIIYKLIRPFKKKIIYHIHSGDFHNFYEQSNRNTGSKVVEFINNANCLVTLSNKWHAYYSDKFSPLKNIIIPNIIPYDANSIKYKEFCRENEVVVFLFLGFIDNNKGIWLLMETLKKHKKEIVGKAVFNIGGNGETQKLLKLIKEYELEEVVNFMGWVSGVDKMQCLQEADIYLLPSLNEGMPISILEAMSYSLPILSTTVGGIPEVVSSENGFLIAPGSKEELWGAINYFMDLNPEQRKKLGQVSLKKVQPHLPKQVHANLNQLYSSLLKE